MIEALYKAFTQTTDSVVRQHLAEALSRLFALEATNDAIQIKDYRYIKTKTYRNSKDYYNEKGRLLF